jgi:hypothetical protein
MAPPPQCSQLEASLSRLQCASAPARARRLAARWPERRRLLNPAQQLLCFGPAPPGVCNVLVPTSQIGTALCFGQFTQMSGGCATHVCARGQTVGQTARQVHCKAVTSATGDESVRGKLAHPRPCHWITPRLKEHFRCRLLPCLCPNGLRWTQDWHQRVRPPRASH